MGRNRLSIEHFTGNSKMEHFFFFLSSKVVSIHLSGYRGLSFFKNNVVRRGIISCPMWRWQRKTQLREIIFPIGLVATATCLRILCHCSSCAESIKMRMRYETTDIVMLSAVISTPALPRPSLGISVEALTRAQGSFLLQPAPLADPSSCQPSAVSTVSAPSPHFLRVAPS